MSNYLFVKEFELEDYQIRARQNNKIRGYWKKILSELPANLYKEICSKFTNLVKGDKSKYEISGALPYLFETKNGSKELNELLRQYVIFVEHDTKEITEWKVNLTKQHHK